MVCTFKFEYLGGDVPVYIGFYNSDLGIYRQWIGRESEEGIVWRFLCWLRDNNYGGVPLYSHFSRKQDSLVILDCLLRRGEVVNPQMGLGQLFWDSPKGTFRFYDSQFLLRLSLDRACDSFGVPREERPSSDLAYYSLEDEDWILENLQKYCRCLSRVYEAWARRLIDDWSIETPKFSLASTSLEILDTFVDLNTIESNRSSFLWAIKEAVFPMRREVVRRFGKGVKVYDINTQYIDAMDVNVPVGPLSWVAKPCLERGTLAYAEVEVPETSYLGPLGKRINLNGHTRPAFPVGKWKSWYDMTELRYAAGLGVKIKLERQLEADEEPVLLPFRDKLLHLISMVPYSLRSLMKAIGVQLVGKLCQLYDRNWVVHVSRVKDFQGFCPVEPSGTYWEGPRKESSGLKRYLDWSLKPLISMRVYSTARIRHYGYILKSLDLVGPEGVFYFNTDSIATTADLTDYVGVGPGQLKLVWDLERAYFLGLSFYGGIDSMGKMHQKASGYNGERFKEKDFLDLLRGGTVVKKMGKLSFPSTKEILEGIEPKGHLLDKVFRIGEGSLGNRVVEEGISTRPMLYDPVEHERPTSETLKFRASLIVADWVSRGRPVEVP